jgi:membrane associated rhomboid family serine protease
MQRGLWATTDRAAPAPAYNRRGSSESVNDFSSPYRSGPRVIQSLFPPFRGAVRALILTCTGVFVLQIALRAGGLDGFDPGGVFLQVMGLVPYEAIFGFRIWQPVSYLFLHGGFGHLLFNMLALWMFGAALEWEWGPRRFLGYYFLTGIGAGLVSIAFTPFSMNPTIGASGAIYGLLLAFGVLHPNRPIFIYGIFPVKAKWLVITVGVLTLWASWASTGGGIAHIAHLGGMVFGYVYLKRLWRIDRIYQEIRWRIRRRRFRVVRRDGGNGDPRYPFH